MSETRAKKAAPGVVGRKYRVWEEPGTPVSNLQSRNRYSLGVFKTVEGARRKLAVFAAVRGQHPGAWRAGIEEITTTDIVRIGRGADE